MSLDARRTINKHVADIDADTKIHAGVGHVSLPMSAFGLQADMCGAPGQTLSSMTQI